MLGPGDELLAVISARWRMPWYAYRDAFDALHSRALLSTSALDEPVGSIRRRSLRLLSELAHAEALPHGASTAVAASPTVLARVPQAGLPRAVLAGSRDLGAAELLRQTCKPFRYDATVVVEVQPHSGGYAPTAIAVDATEEAILQRVADCAGIRFARQPPAWRILGVSASVAEYEALLSWTSDPDPDWPRKDFNTSMLAFRFDHHEAPTRLSLFTDPVTHRQVDRIWRDGRVANNRDRDWGRWLYLRYFGRDVVLFDCNGQAVGVPVTVPLPRLLARALTLFSGIAPRRQPHPRDPSLEVDVYAGVPKEAAELVADKVGQHLLPEPLAST